MRWSLIASTLVHTAILLAAVVSFSSPEEFETKFDEAPVVDLVDPSEFSKAVALSQDGKENVEDPANKTQKAVRLEGGTPQPEPPQPQEEQKKEPEPAPKELPKEAELPPLEEVIDIPALAKPPEPEPEPEKQPEPEPKVEPEPKKAETEPEKPKAAKPRPKRKPKIAKKKPKKKRKFDADALSALLDKSIKETSPRKEATGDGTQRKAERNALGDQTELSATELDWLIDKVQQCYRIPGGVADSKKWRVTLQFRTDARGQVIGAPIVVKSAGGETGPIATEVAIRALLACAPYDRFESFKNNVFRINFDPDRMVHG